MLYIKLVRNFYLALTILAFLLPIEFNFLDFFPGIILMWLLYYIYFFFQSKPQKVVSNKSFEIYDSNIIFTLTITLLYFLFYPIYTKFYTGTSLFTSIFSFGTGISNYANYQQYFLDNELNTFSIAKLPYILGHSLLKLSFIFIVFRYFIYQNKKSRIELFCIFLISLIYILVGVTRGTSFEMFEIFNLFLFVYVIHRQKNGKRNIMTVKSFLYLITIFILSVSYFVFNIKQRFGGEFDFTSLSGYNKNSFISLYLPSLSILLFSLYGYFIFGIHYTSILCKNLWFDSLSGFLSMFIPDGISKYNFSDSTRDFVDKFINVGAQWTPETVSVIEHFGLLILVLIIVLLGFLTKFIISKIHYSISSVVILFYIYLYLISLPIGNFLTVSSSNKICLILATSILVYNNIFKIHGK
jgi:hypothetical protein